MSAYTNHGDRVLDNDGNIVASRNAEDWVDTFMGKRWFFIRVEELNGKHYYVTKGCYLGFVEDVWWDIGVIKRNLDIYLDLGVWDAESFLSVVDLFTLLERGWGFTNDYELDNLYDVADFEHASGVLDVENFFHQVGMGVINYGQGENAARLERELELNDDDSAFWDGSGLSFGTMNENEFIPSEVIINIMESWQPDPDDDITVSDASGHEVIDLTSVVDVIDLTTED